jgi:hypothetical protein
MSRFIRLTNLLLNTHAIEKILIHPSKYYIYTRKTKIDGFEFKIAGSGGGWINSKENYEIEICETKDPTDFKTLSDWISKIE